MQWLYAQKATSFLDIKQLGHPSNNFKTSSDGVDMSRYYLFNRGKQMLHIWCLGLLFDFFITPLLITLKRED